MPPAILLTLYDPATEAVERTLSRSFVPWKMLKQAIRLNQNLGDKPPEQYAEADVDELTQFIISIFGNGLTVEILDEQSDVTEMINVLRAIVSRARGIMDPTLPSKAR
jgi:hypothetical protein